MEGIAGFIWRSLSEGKSRERVIASLMESFQIDDSTAARDLDDFIAEALKAGVLVQHEPVAPVLALAP
jgi:Coenzyme PQQ synthesis protein D (PqqD)